MAEKILKTRIIHTHDTLENWDSATSFIPLKGEIIVYDNLNQIKIGNGNTSIKDLPFIADWDNVINKPSLLPTSWVDNTATGSNGWSSEKVDIELNKKLDKPVKDGVSGEFLAHDGTWKSIPHTLNIKNGAGNISIQQESAMDATGANSIALGAASTASGPISCAIGKYTTASGKYAYAQGNQTQAEGEASDAKGALTIAKGICSSAAGEGTIANDYQTALGKYNKESINEAFTIGNGTSDTTRSNAMSIDWQGNTYLAGDLILGNNCKFTNSSTRTSCFWIGG